MQYNDFRIFSYTDDFLCEMEIRKVAFIPINIYSTLYIVWGEYQIQYLCVCVSLYVCVSSFFSCPIRDFRFYKLKIPSLTDRLSSN